MPVIIMMGTRASECILRDEIDMTSVQDGKDSFSIMCFADAIALRFQAPAKQQADFGIVVDNEYVGLGHAKAAPVMAENFTFQESNVKVSPLSVRDQDRYRHVFEHEVVAPPKTNSLIWVCP